MKIIIEKIEKDETGNWKAFDYTKLYDGETCITFGDDGYFPSTYSKGSAPNNFDFISELKKAIEVYEKENGIIDEKDNGTVDEKYSIPYTESEAMQFFPISIIEEIKNLRAMNFSEDFILKILEMEREQNE